VSSSVAFGKAVEDDGHKNPRSLGAQLAAADVWITCQEFAPVDHALSPRRKVIVRAHLGAVPILGKSGQSAAQVRGLLRVDPSVGEADRCLRPNQCHDHASSFRVIQRLDQLDLPVAIDAFNGLHHASIMPKRRGVSRRTMAS